MEIIYEPWPWYVAGPMIALVFTLLHLFGKNFGMSSNFETMCTIGGAGKVTEYFNKDWKSKTWSLFVILGVIIGGFLGEKISNVDQVMDIAPESIAKMRSIGVEYIPGSFEPSFLSVKAFSSSHTLLYLILGGLFIGFGTRWANGCTSGHAISGLANFQFSSLIAVIGFFIGGLTMTHFLLPYLL